MIGMNRNVKYWKKEIAQSIVYNEIPAFMENSEENDNLTEKELKALGTAAIYIDNLITRKYILDD